MSAGGKVVDIDILADAFIETYSGERVNITNPVPLDFKLIDIAQALSFTTRFGGHTQWFYSVAEHSIFCSYLAKWNGASQEEQQIAFLHDAHEAYLGDIPTPLKKQFNGFLEVADKLDFAIVHGLGLPFDELKYPDLERIDLLALSMEVPHLTKETPAQWGTRLISKDEFPEIHDVAPGGVELSFFPKGGNPIELIRKAFLERAKELGIPV